MTKKKITKPILTDDGWLVPEGEAAEELNAELLREKQEKILKVLQAGAELDAELQFDLMISFRELVETGRIPELFKPTIPQRNSLVSEEAIKDAVRFLRWAEYGKIPEVGLKEAKKLVMETFSVSRDTVKNWMIKHTNTTIADPIQLDNESLSKKVTDIMKMSAIQYRARKKDPRKPSK
ncbi:hypothetical protein TDB9533_03571 [Thalassocella blandensis]|nr:hypothetical protein TDB9533_03571 [Thalassocella blandensis]